MEQRSGETDENSASVNNEGITSTERSVPVSENQVTGGGRRRDADDNIDSAENAPTSPSVQAGAARRDNQLLRQQQQAPQEEQEAPTQPHQQRQQHHHSRDNRHRGDHSSSSSHRLPVGSARLPWSRSISSPPSCSAAFSSSSVTGAASAEALHQSQLRKMAHSSVPGVACSSSHLSRSNRNRHHSHHQPPSRGHEQPQRNQGNISPSASRSESAAVPSVSERTSPPARSPSLGIPVISSGIASSSSVQSAPTFTRHSSYPGRGVGVGDGGSAWNSVGTSSRSSSSGFGACHRSRPSFSPPSLCPGGWTVVPTVTSTTTTTMISGGGTGMGGTGDGATNTPNQRSLHTAAVLHGTMYVFGGYDGQARVNDFHSFSFAEARWSPVVPATASGPPPSPRDRHVSVAHGNSFYVFGGFDGISRVSDFFEFDLSSMTWREITPTEGSAPSARHSHSAVVYDGSMFVFGGYDGSYRSDLNEFDFETFAWHPVPATGRPPRARYRGTCVVINNTMILFGGHDGTRHLADTHVFDFDTRAWSSLITDGVPPIPRDSHASVAHGNSMYVFGGSTGSAMNDLHELEMPSSTCPTAKWRQINPAGAVVPGHRFCHVAVVYGDSMYVFGGYDGSNRLNDFIRFDFEVDDLICEVPQSTLISDLRSFVNNETLSDVTFIVEGHEICAHKIFLTRCSYFRAMFTGAMRESNQPTIRLEQVRHPIFLLVLEYLYTDDLGIPLDYAMELFVAADLFDIPRLKSMCERAMLESINVDNAATIFHAADLHTAVSLRSKALTYILYHFEAVSKTPAFEEMARSNVELVFEILRSR